MKIRTIFPILILFIGGLLSACTSTVTTVNPPLEKPSASVEQPSPTPAAIPQPPPELPANRVEVVYFHMPMRCATCRCFEERADYVVKTYFKNELASGKLTFEICDLGNKKKAALIRKYNSFNSQLFINTIINNTDQIEDIKDIWNWRCTGDKEGFDAKVRSVIEQSLAQIK